MSAKALVRIYETLPEHLKKEMEVFLQFLEGRVEANLESIDALKVTLKDVDSPLDPKDFAVSEKDLKELKEMFAEGPEAEELCNMLTK